MNKNIGPVKGFLHKSGLIMKKKGVLKMGKEYSQDCCLIPPCPGVINNKNDNQMRIEIDNSKCYPVPECTCEREELIKNGGFEMLNADRTQVFAHWRAVNQISDTTIVFESFSPSYEGFRAAQFQTNPSPSKLHALSLQQHVTITPGCIYQFSFAEKFLGGSGGANAEASLIGRVYYTDCAGNQFDLIIIPIAKANIDNNIDKGYTFHQKTAAIPVPCDVSKVTVQFDFSIEEDTGGTRWLLDGVSLRALSSASSCVRNDCASSLDTCRTTNLVKNGDFEDFTEINRASPFLYWWQIPESGNEAIVEVFNSADYEGLFQALFVSLPTVTAQTKSVSLRQIVTVTPGCRLELSFAEYFLQRGESAGDTPRLIGRVFWINDSGTEFELINVPMAKINADYDVDKGYSFHKKTSDQPVPCNVTSVYVQFDFSVTDVGVTQWALDAVQLRAVPWDSACCQDFQEVSEYAG